MEFKNDKLCYRLLILKQKHSKLSKQDKKHLQFLNDENINIQSVQNKLDQELYRDGYLEQDASLKIDEGLKRVRFSYEPNNQLIDGKTKIDKGIALYSKHSESIKNNQELENQFFVMLKNYWWLLGIALLLAWYFLKP